MREAVQEAEDLDDVEARTRIWWARLALEDVTEQVRRMRAMAAGPGASEAGEAVTEELIPLRSAMLEHIDVMYARLLHWCRVLAAPEPVPLPARVVWRSSRGHIGFRPGTTPDGAAALVSLLAQWLRTHLESVRVQSHPDYEEFLADVTARFADLMEDYRAAQTELRPPRRMHRRPCPDCGEIRVAATSSWLIGHRVIAVECEVCGWKPETLPDYTAWLD